MKTVTIVILVAIVVCVAIVVAENRLRKKHHYHLEGLKDAVDKIFARHGGESMRRVDFLKALQHYYNSSRKETYYLFGKAREQGFVSADENEVEKCV